MLHEEPVCVDIIMSRDRSLTPQIASILQYTTQFTHTVPIIMQRKCDWLSNNTDLMHVQFMKKLVHQIYAIFTFDTNRSG